MDEEFKKSMKSSIMGKKSVTIKKYPEAKVKKERKNKGNNDKSTMELLMAPDED